MQNLTGVSEYDKESSSGAILSRIPMWHGHVWMDPTAAGSEYGCMLCGFQRKVHLASSSSFTVEFYTGTWFWVDGKQ